MASSSGRGGTCRASRCFLLENLEVAPAVEKVAVDELGVVLVHGVLSSLAILPATDPTILSYEWIGSGGIRAPPQSAPSRSHGTRGLTVSSSLSVNSGLTDAPSL